MMKTKQVVAVCCVETTETACITRPKAYMGDYAYTVTYLIVSLPQIMVLSRQITTHTMGSHSSLIETLVYHYRTATFFCMCGAKN